MKLARAARGFRIDKPEKFRIKDHDPDETCGLDLGERNAKALLAKSVRELDDLQERLYAQDRWSLLVIIQAMDAAGKDGVIEHVMSGVNPQGVQVHSFKAPSAEELDHDFMWRTTKCLPERGRIGIFNRSYYEETLVVRVHPEILAKQRLPPEVVNANIWKHRLKDIRAFERYLVRNGTIVLKFFLNVSKEEQRKRFLARLDEPGKRWKFSMGDVAERKLWPKYMEAFEEMIRKTSRPHAPWYVIPADDKAFCRLMVATAMVEALRKLDLKFPTIEGDPLRELGKVRQALAAEGPAPPARKEAPAPKLTSRRPARTAS